MALLLPSCWAQINPVSVVPPQNVFLKAGGTATVAVRFGMMKGYHVNSDKPLEKHLIPLKFNLKPEPLELAGIVYPKPHTETYQFQKEPLSVVTGAFAVMATINVPANAPKGTHKLAGTLRYQACTDSICLSPRSVAFTIPVVVR